MPILCNCKLQLQNICLESAQGPWWFMPMSAWAHNFCSSQDLDTFLFHPRIVFSPASHQQDLSTLWCQSHLNLLQFVSHRTSMMSATKISLRLNKVSNSITIIWGMLVSSASSTYAPKNDNFQSLMVHIQQQNLAFWQKIPSKSLVRHQYVQHILPLICTNVLMVPTIQNQMPKWRMFYVLVIWNLVLSFLWISASLQSVVNFFPLKGERSCHGNFAGVLSFTIMQLLNHGFHQVLLAAFDAIKSFLVMREAMEHGVELKCFHTDNGTFQSKGFVEALKGNCCRDVLSTAPRACCECREWRKHVENPRKSVLKEECNLLRRIIYDD